MAIAESAKQALDRNTTIAVFLAAMVLWFLNHPFLGVAIHDARIYLVLALHWINPDAYARDPFFMFGTQDSWSVFSSLYGPLIGWLGLTAAAVVVLLVGAALWCFAAIVMTKSVMPRGWVAGMAVLALASVSINYSPNYQTFFLNEAFATARSIAFPFGVLAMACCVQGRLQWALGLSLATSLLHPLIGVWPLAMSSLWQMSKRQCALVIGAGVTLLVGLMGVELGPFARFDAEWEQILRVSTQDVFVANFEIMRWHDHAVQLGLLLLVGLHVAGSPRRLYFIAALLSGLGLLIAAIASYYWPSQIVIQAQLWRGMWLAAYLMPLALCHMLLIILSALSRRQHEDKLWSLLALVSLAFLLRDTLLLVLLFWLIGATLYHCSSLARDRLRYFWLSIEPWQSKFSFKALSMAVFLLALPGVGADLALLEGSVPLPFNGAPSQLVGLLVHGGYGLGFALVAYLIHHYSQRWQTNALLVTLLFLAVLHWDMRSESERQWDREVAFRTQGDLSRLVKPSDVVLSDGRVPMLAWYGLRTANYASPMQAIGIVFSRDKTKELLRRAERIQTAASLDELGSRTEGGAKPVRPQQGLSVGSFDFTLPRGKGIAALCGDQQLDWLVLKSYDPSVQNGMNHRYEIKDEMGKVKQWAFDCAAIRASTQ